MANRVTRKRWEQEVAVAIVQLCQEVHALNPGLFWRFDLDLIETPAQEDGEIVDAD